MTFSSIRRSWHSRLISLCLVVAFVVSMVITPGFSYAQGVPGLPEPGTMVNLSSSYVPLMITGLTVHPENPLLMDFIVSTGNSGLNAAQVKEQSSRLIKYFLACLTIPENDQWVNLSPYEKQRIVPEDLGQTVLGQDMLAQDYLLKQLTASLIDPDKDLGRDFWNNVYAKARQMYGTTQVPVNTFNKVWILPDTARVFEHNNTVFVVKSHLKVMLDEDYLALSKHADIDAGVIARSEATKQSLNTLGNQIVRRIVLPAIEQEVNGGKNFAQLRQIYNSMILSVWFKQNLKQALLNQVYTDKSKVNGVNADDPAVKEKIYKQYLQAYKKGVFNYIKEEVDPNTREIVPRKYFSGGLTPVTHVDEASLSEAEAAFSGMQGTNYVVSGLTQNASPVNPDAAMTTGQPGQDLENILSGKLLTVKEKMQPLLDAYYAAKAAGQADEAKRLDGEINKIVDELNVYNQSRPEDLVLSDDIEPLSGFLNSPNAGEDQRLARLDLLDGNYVPQFIFAGAATRLNRGPMYNLDIWDIAVELGKAKAEDAKSHMGMGPRQIMAYRLALEDMARQNGLSAQDVLGRQKIIVNVNADIEQTVLDDFIKNDFYGFKPENVYFIDQPTFHGFKFQNGTLEFDPQSPTVPYGHGYNFMQLGQNGQAFILDAGGDRHYLNGSVLDQFPSSVLIGSHRINDLTKLSKDSVISVDKLAFAISKLRQGFDIVGELVDNPNKQKGGNVLKDTSTGQSFLIETSNVKGSPELIKLLDEAGKAGAPYNAFRLIYGVSSLKNILQKNLPYNLRFKDGYFYLEAVTGDVTQMPETRAKFMSSGEEIHDFKEPKNIDDALKYLRLSDDQLTHAADHAMNAKTNLSIYELRSALEKGIASGPSDVSATYGGQILHTENWPNKDKALQIISALEEKVGANTGRRFSYDVGRYDNNLTFYISDAAMTVATKPIDANARMAKFGTSGDRGIIDWPQEGRAGDFNIGLVRRDTQGIAEYGLQTTPAGQRTVLIGYDTRFRNPEFSKEEARIMAANGFKVLYVKNKPVPTPVLASYVAQRKSAMFGVINNTASHSPYTDGGLKFFPSHGGAAGTETTDTIQKLANEAKEYKTMDYDEAVKQGLIVELDADDLVKEYVDGYLIPTMKATRSLDGRSMWQDIVDYQVDHPEFNLIVDPLQGTGVDTDVLLHHRFAEAVGRQVAEIIHTNNKDPKFSEIKKNAPQPMGDPVSDLIERIKSNPHSFGLAQDGDVDRFGVIDFGGQEVSANDMVALLAWFLKKDVGLNGAVVKTVATSNFANAVARHLGLKLIETPVGFKYTVEQITKGEDVLVGGEESAHVGTKPFVRSWDDGFATGLMALWIVAKTGRSLMEYKKEIEAEIGQAYHMKAVTVRDEQGVAKNNVIALIDGARQEMRSKPALEINLAKKAEELTGQKVESINTMDGLKLVFESGDWVLMRPSGTEPAAKLYVEVSNPQRLDSMFKIAQQLMGGADKAQMSDGVKEDDEGVPSDAAMAVNYKNPTSEVAPGGIDLNSSNLKMQSEGQKVNITFDPAMIVQFKRGDFSGVRIKILDVVPVNLMPLLGLREE